MGFAFENFDVVGRWRDKYKRARDPIDTTATMANGREISDIVDFKKEQAQTISYMVKEFEMRKSADLYKRSTVAKTGQLNMNTLHSYSYNEDIS